MSTQIEVQKSDQFVQAVLPLAEYATIGIDPMLGPMESKVSSFRTKFKGIVWFRYPTQKIKHFYIKNHHFCIKIVIF